MQDFYCDIDDKKFILKNPANSLNIIRYMVDSIPCLQGVFGNALIR